MTGPWHTPNGHHDERDDGGAQEQAAELARLEAHLSAECPEPDEMEDL